MSSMPLREALKACVSYHDGDFIPPYVITKLLSMTDGELYEYVHEENGAVRTEQPKTWIEQLYS